MVMRSRQWFAEIKERVVDLEESSVNCCPLFFGASVNSKLSFISISIIKYSIVLILQFKRHRNKRTFFFFLSVSQGRYVDHDSGPKEDKNI